MKRFFKGILCGMVVFSLLAVSGSILRDQLPGVPVMLAESAHAAPKSVLLVNAWHPLPAGFAADDLVNLYGEKRHFKLAASDICLTREAFEAANQMFRQASRDGIDGFTITSGYRTAEKQRALYENDENGTAAMPGTSEHQSGLAFDVTTRYDSGSFADTAQFRWLSEHCWEYGFILRYPEGREETTGVPYEPWHYRYVGVEIAQEIRANGWTLEDYCERNGA